MNNREVESNNSVKETEDIVSKIEKLEGLNSEEIVEEIEEIQVEEVKTEEVKTEEKRKGFMSRLMASLLDQVVCAGLTVIVLFIISAIINMFGYRFVLLGNYNMFIIIYIITNVLYGPIMEATNLKKTLGKMFLKI